VNSRTHQGSKIGPLKGQQGGFGLDCSCRPPPTFDILPFFPLSHQPDKGLTFPLFPYLSVRLPAFPRLRQYLSNLALGGKEVKSNLLI
jgi:hypothetical protein